MSMMKIYGHMAAATSRQPVILRESTDPVHERIHDATAAIPADSVDR